MSVYDSETYYNIIVPRLEKLADLFEDCICEIKNLDNNRSGGVVIKNSQGKILYSIDISLMNDIVGNKIEYNFDGEFIIGSSMNKILADKIVSTLSKKRFRRVKDFYDIYIILTSGYEYDTSTILKLMRDKCTNDELNDLFNNIPFDEIIINELAKAWNKLEVEVYKEGEPTKIDKPDMLIIITEVYNIYFSLKDRFMGGKLVHVFF